MFFLKIAIIGSRKIYNPDKIYNLIKENIPSNCSEIVSGGAAGIDTLAEKYADEVGIRKKIILPDYKKYGRSAPLIRNKEIIEYADIVYAFWDINSRGTANSLQHCIESGTPMKVFSIKK